MKFKCWFENDETQERTTSFEKYIQALTTLATKYHFTIHPKYIEHEKQTFMTMPIEELRREMTNLPKFLQEKELEYKREQIEKERKEKKEQGRYKGYYRAEDSYERIVCSHSDPQFHIKGMPAYPIPELKGYYGVHVGGGWLGILKRDGYCDGDAYLYTIHADQMNEDGIAVYYMEDPHVSYKDNATPDSWIIFSKKKIIPAKYVELNEVIPEKEIREAPPPYGMD